jgi:hypothetical protein
MPVDPFLLAVLAGMFGLLLVPGAAVLAGLRRYREDLRARRSPPAYRVMVVSPVGAGCCFLLVPFAVVAGVWTTLAALGETSFPGASLSGRGPSRPWGTRWGCCSRSPCWTG